MMSSLLNKALQNYASWDNARYKADSGQMYASARLGTDTLRDYSRLQRRESLKAGLASIASLLPGYGPAMAGTGLSLLRVFDKPKFNRGTYYDTELQMQGQLLGKTIKDFGRLYHTGDTGISWLNELYGLPKSGGWNDKNQKPDSFLKFLNNGTFYDNSYDYLKQGYPYLKSSYNYLMPYLQQGYHDLLNYFR